MQKSDTKKYVRENNKKKNKKTKSPKSWKLLGTQFEL